jgi:hypothetical protein
VENVWKYEKEGKTEGKKPLVKTGVSFRIP